MTRKRGNEKIGGEDSSDEEEIVTRNSNYSFIAALDNIDFVQVAENFNRKYGDRDRSVSELQVIKSFLLHNIGRMIIYNLDLDGDYRALKKRLMPEQDYVLAVNYKDDINTKSLKIPLKSLADLLVFGRLVRRSQMRLYPDLDRDGEKILVKAAFILDGENVESEVEETIVASGRGLGLPKWPYMDMVKLKLDKGDYASAYKGNRFAQANVAISQVELAANSVAEQNNSPDLKEAIKIMVLLKDQIAEHFKNQDSDIFIADKIQKVCLGEPLIDLGNHQVIKDKIYALAYLLFKTEVYRSPAALANNMQMLDLIKVGRLSFDQAFVQQQMPMSMSGAIKAARSLNECYSDLDDNSSFYRYYYPYDYAYSTITTFSTDSSGEMVVETKEDSKVIELVTKEAAMFDCWVDYKFVGTKASEVKANPKAFLTDICRSIDNLINRFGLQIESESWHMAKSKQAETLVNSSSINGHVR